MQAKATGAQRYGINRIAILALAIGILAIAAALAISNIEFGADKPADILVAHPAPLQGEGRVDPANSVVATPGTLPVLRYTAPYAGEGRLEMRLLDRNALPAGNVTEPAESFHHMRLLERDTWAYDGDGVTQPASDYLYPAIQDRLPSPPASAGIVTAPSQSLDHMRFLEQNLWELDDGSATSPVLDDYLYAEEYVAGQAMEDASTAATAVHPDKYPDDYRD